MADYGQLYGAGQSGAAGITQAPSTKVDTIFAVTMDLDHNIERLNKLVEALHLIGDRVSGGRPEPVGQPGGAPDGPSNSMIHDLRRRHNAISERIGRCEDELRRVVQGLGITS